MPALKASTLCSSLLHLGHIGGEGGLCSMHANFMGYTLHYCRCCSHHPTCTAILALRSTPVVGEGREKWHTEVIMTSQLKLARVDKKT